MSKYQRYNKLKKFLFLLFSLSVPFLFYSMVDAEALVLDFDDLSSGEIVSSQFLESYGVMISANNPTGPDIAIIFDSLNPTGWDDDLAGHWAGGNLASENAVLDKILIIAENDIDKDLDGLIDDPDDEGSRPAGSLFFDFEYPLCSVGFDIIDVEGPSEFGNDSGFVATFFMDGSELARVGFDQFINENSLFFDSTIDYGNNKANRISPITVDALSVFTSTSITAFDKVEFNLGGSSAIDNIAVSTCETSMLEVNNNEIEFSTLESGDGLNIPHTGDLSSQDKIEELEQRINFLEEQVVEKDEEISKKDQVLKEQLKVINDLATKIQKIILDYIHDIFISQT